MEAGTQSDMMTLRPRPHPWRWVSGFLALSGLVGVGVVLANAQIEWSVVPQYLFSSAVLSGLQKTILISVLAMAMGLMISVIFAVMRLSPNPVTSGIAWLYVWLFRGTPVFLQLLMWFNLALILPQIHIPGVVDAETTAVITPFLAALLGLGINEGAYLTEIIRGGILSVDSGQTLAAKAHGLSKRQTLRRIVLPQAMPAILPTIGNEAIGMLKFSALATVIGYTELLNSVQSIYFINAHVMELLFVAAFWYLVATSITSIGQYYLEHHFGRSQARRRSVADQLLRYLLAKVRPAS
jgi:polar amino acid transport system permease protein